MDIKIRKRIPFYFLLTLICIFLAIISFRQGILPAVGSKLTGISLTTSHFADFIKSLGGWGAQVPQA